MKDITRNKVFQIQAPVTANTEIIPGVHLVKLHAPGLARLAQPGQYIMLSCRQGLGNLLRRPFSIHQIDGDYLSVLFSVIGNGTEWLSHRIDDEKLDIIGPLGIGFTRNPTSHNILAVAGGIGIAPLCFLIRKLGEEDCSTKLLLGARTAGQLYPVKLLPPNVEVITATEDGTEGTRGMITGLLPEYVEWADQIFVCGPLPMYRNIVHNYGLLLENKAVQVSLEVRMGCGLGICYSCTIKTKTGLKQVCKDGPVFELQDILWDSVAI